MKKIFCVEDDANIRELIEYTLKSMGFETKGFECGEEFFKILKKEIPDCLLLDIMLPDKDGMEILKELRINEDTKRLPIIMLTAKTSQIDKIKGLDAGADDYITKPFDIMELVSRIKALLRRVQTPVETNRDILVYKNLTINMSSRCVFVNDKELSLTYKEFELLYFLILNKGTVLTREKLMNEIWGITFEGETRTVDVHIRTLRQKLGECGEYIETVRNVGYKIA